MSSSHCISLRLTTCKLQAAVSAIKTAPNVQQARAVFDDLSGLGLASHTAAHNALLRVLAEVGEWEEALHAFRMMVEAEVPATTATYNALLDACVRGAPRRLSFHDVGLVLTAYGGINGVEYSMRPCSCR